MSDENKQVAQKSADDLAFEAVQRKAKLYTASELVPKIYQGNTPTALANTVIALNLAHRIGADELMVMQNLFVIQGRPSWSSVFIISALNSCGKFSPIRFVMNDLGTLEVAGKKVKNLECRAVCNELVSGERLEGPAVSIQTAIAEGWYTKSGSKWPNMPELMLRYRAAAFFGRLYAPELLNGMQTIEESEDDGIRNVTPATPESIIGIASVAKEALANKDADDDFKLESEKLETIDLSELLITLEEYAQSESTPESCRKEISETLARGESDIAKLTALLEKTKAAHK